MPGPGFRAGEDKLCLKWIKVTIIWQFSSSSCRAQSWHIGTLDNNVTADRSLQSVSNYGVTREIIAIDNKVLQQKVITFNSSKAF